MSGTDWRDPVLQLIDGLAALAEAIGALPYENPAHGRYGQNIHLAIPELTDTIKRKLRFPIHRPKVMGNHGIGRDSGVIDFRVPDDAYCAHRITHPRRCLQHSVHRNWGRLWRHGAVRIACRRDPLAYNGLADYEHRTGVFLIKCLGGDTVRLFGEDNPAPAVEALPYWGFFDRARDYAVVFNRYSLPEIPRDRVDEYLVEIERRGASLLSINHEAGAPAQLNLLQIIAEHGKLECRSRHPYWIRRGLRRGVIYAIPPMNAR
jgi:hypothetical protein